MEKVSKGIKRLLQNKKIQGAFITGVLTFTIILFFFGSALKNINNTLFAPGGDGLKCYYCVKYHVKYDESLMRFDGMNYPFGEYVVYTDGMTPVANTLKVLKPIIDLSDYTVAIINLIMLLSAVVGAVYLYLIFEKLKVKQLLAVPFAVGIIFLSPQWVRVLGHFSLSLHFFIPLIIYHLLAFKENKSWWQVTWIAFATFVMMSMHPYYYPMSAVIVASFFLVYGALHQFQLKYVKKYGFQFLTLLVSPFLIFNVLIKIFDTSVNRTKLPWGFWEFQSNTTGLFFPFGKPYEEWAHKIADPLEVSWEGVAYVGLFAMLFFIVGVAFLFYRIFKDRSTAIFRSQRGVAIMFLGLVFLFGMMISFAFPFNMGLEDWLDRLGSIKQLRGIGRYAWLCYFALNIIALLILDRAIRNAKVALSILVVLPSLSILYVDGYYLIKDIPDKIQNISETWNKLPSDHWSNYVDMKEYQCLVPFPYFHVGSENLGMNTPEEFKADIFTTSASCGIPTTGVNMSRTSIDQSNELIEMHQQPYRVPKVLDQFNNEKPLLCVVKLPEGEAYLETLFENEEPEYTSEEIVLFSITPSQWKKSVEDYNVAMVEEIKDVYDSIPEDEVFSSDSSFFYISNEPMEFNINEYMELAQVNTASFNGENSALMLNYSFWLSDIYVDLYARSALEITFENESGIHGEYFGLHDHCSQIEGNKGLFEFEFEVKRGDKMKFTLMNGEIVNPLKVEISSQQLRRNSSAVITLHQSSVEINNRTYQK